MRLWIATCVLGLISACARSAPPSRVRTNHATCEAMCDYYQYCKGSAEEQRHDACISDCRSIFSEDGRMDRHALLQLQRLECSELLSFIEGEQERPLTSSTEL
jgi:hypothetical protein